ncbi:MAG: OmpA family protein [Cytophagaceae bacterium]|jgi:outer membrane protein OmpA-like peptidoglycan-associated protein|nr:OmpA family protein [Cytophagaceae bacterium]
MSRLLLVAFFFACLLGSAQQVKLPVSMDDFIEYAPSVSPDGKYLVFQSNRTGMYGLYECELKADGQWSEARSLDKLNDWSKPQRLIGGPCYSADGNSLYFCALKDGGYGEMDIYVATKKNNQWTNPENLGSRINSEHIETFPSISADQKTLFFSRTLLGDTSRCPKLMKSEKDENGRWKDAVEVNATESCAKTPRLLYDQNYLLLSGKSAGSFDIVRLKLSNGQYQEAMPMKFANQSTQQETGASLSKREDMLVFASNGDLFFHPIPNEYRMHGKVWNGTVIDKENKKGIPALLYVIDTLAKDTVYRVKANDQGKYSLNLPPFSGIKVLVKAEKYYSYQETVAISEADPFELVTRTIELKPYKREVIFKVSDSESNKSLKVKIKVTNIDTKEESIIDAEGSRDGQYAINLREGNKYNIEISSIEGYAFVNQTIDVPTQSENIVANNSVALNTEKISMPVDIKLQPLKDNTKLELKDIYFESNSAALSDSSYKELARVIDLMKVNKSAKIEISAHTDDLGTDEYNNTLSQKRAQEIVKYLVSKGVSSSKLVAKGYGKTKPKVANTSDENRAINRRVEMKILDIK